MKDEERDEKCSKINSKLDELLSKGGITLRDKLGILEATKFLLLMETHEKSRREFLEYLERKKGI